MNSLKKSVALACAASVFGLGVAFAQDTPAAPATPDPSMAAPAAPGGGDAMKPMMKKKMSKKKMMKKKKMM